MALMYTFLSEKEYFGQIYCLLWEIFWDHWTLILLCTYLNHLAPKPNQGIVVIRSGQLQHVSQMLSNIKNSALKYYMPCWMLAELKAVGNHIVEGNHALKELMSSQAIEERYKRFGGIILVDEQ